MLYKIKKILLLCLPFFILSCHGNSQDVYMKNLEKFKSTINFKLPIGAPKKAVDDYLASQNIEYTYLDDERIFYAIIPNIGHYRIIYTSSLLIRIKVDGDLTVEKIEYEIEHSGL